MPTSKIINIMVEQERTLDNNIHTLNELAESGVLPMLSILSLQAAQDELQNEINKWLPEWFPGTSTQSYFFQHPEDKGAIKKVEEFILAAMQEMANVKDWGQILVKRFPTKTDCFLVEESWESRVSIDEYDNKDEDGLHGLFTMTDIYTAFRKVSRGMLEELVVQIPENHKQQAMEDVGDCLSNLSTAIENTTWEEVCTVDEANLLAQVCLFGGMKYML